MRHRLPLPRPRPGRGGPAEGPGLPDGLARGLAVDPPGLFAGRPRVISGRSPSQTKPTTSGVLRIFSEGDRLAPDRHAVPRGHAVTGPQAADLGRLPGATPASVSSPRRRRGRQHQAAGRLLTIVTGEAAGACA